MRRAEARLSASIINNSSIRCMSTGWQVGCITNTSAPRTFSWICTYASRSLKRVTRAWPRVSPRKWQTSSQSGSLAVPQKTLNRSSTRARCGLRSVFSSVGGFFSAVVFSAIVFSPVVVATVAIGSVLSSRFSVLGFGAPVSRLRIGTWQLRTGYLAGPLGFEPRQSAPKALDLPLVDGPRCTINWLATKSYPRTERQRPTTSDYRPATFSNTAGASTYWSPPPSAPASADGLPPAQPRLATGTARTRSTLTRRAKHTSTPRAPAHLLCLAIRDI